MATGSTSDVNFDKLDFDRIATSKNYIDRGAFGEVYGPFTWNSRECAFKRIWISKGKPGDDFKIKVEAKRLIWIKVKHKNLIEIHNVVFGPKAVYIVMEYASGGSLRNLLDNSDTYRLIDVSNWARQIAGGMLNLHEKDIVHRDLKSNNIMLMDPFDFVCPHKKMTLKITDFDDVREHTHTTTMSFRGTVAYTAPEVLRTNRFSKASDVWSYGVVLWEMLTGGRPHEDIEEGATMVKAQSGQLTFSVPDSVPKAYKELLRDCLDQDQSRRPSFDQIIDLLKSSDNKEDDLKYKSDPVCVDAIRTKAAKKHQKLIRGLAILNEELFVVSALSSIVEVYNSTNFRFSRQCKLEELNVPLDIGSCDRNKCLYIFDYKGLGQSNEILRVDSNGKLIKSWSTGDDHGHGLSVTDESNVILTVYNKNKLNEYSPDGQLIREINLRSDAGIRRPWHAIKLINGHFLISHDDAYADLPKVSIVDTDGKLNKSFGGKPGSSIGQMNSPAYLAVDTNGFVMVSDCNNSRLLLLNSDLEFKREIISNSRLGLHRPSRILFDESKSRLFVADDNGGAGGEVLIFKFA